MFSLEKKNEDTYIITLIKGYSDKAGNKLPPISTGEQGESDVHKIQQRRFNLDVMRDLALRG